VVVVSLYVVDVQLSQVGTTDIMQRTLQYFTSCCSTKTSSSSLGRSWYCQDELYTEFDVLR
jgi:hypothetical protein